MINWNDLYNVVAALVPLYVSMLLAYASVRYWKLFSSDQCSGINRFVSLFAVPLLSFHFISTMNPYTMNLRFLAADSLQKLTILILLSLLHSNITLKFFITFFSISTLPNTLVMGIPLLSAMYGSGAGTLMVQVVVMQCIIWYTLLLFLYEYDSAKHLMTDKAGHEIVSLTVDSDVAELADAETAVGRDGNLRVSKGSSRRLSNLTGLEVCSVGSSRGFSPRVSNFEEWINSDGGKVIPEVCGCDAKELHMFVWNSEESPPSEPLGSVQGGSLESSGGAREIRVMIHPNHVSRPEEGLHNEETKGIASEVGIIDGREEDKEPQSKKGTSSTTVVGDGGGGHDGHVKPMPPARVMSRLILIMVWRKLIRNPNTYSSLIGVVWSLVAFRWDVHMPKVVEKSISILSDAGLGMAMFSLGLFMALQPKIISCGNRKAVLSMGVRFLVGPAVMAVASLVVGIRGTLLHVAIVQAALPQGIVPFVFAKEYNVHAAMLSTAVIFGMLIALPITLLYYFLLGL